MKVYIISHDAGSKKLGMLFRPYFIAQGLKKIGHDVQVIAGSFSHVRRVNPEVKKDLEVHTIEGITYHWLKTLSYFGNSGKRALGLFIFSIKLWLFAGYFARKFAADVVIASSPHPLMVWGAHRLAKKLNAKFIFEVRDIWPLSMFELSGMKKNHPFYILCQWAEDYAYKHADTVVSLLPYAYEHMQTLGLKQEKFVCIPNGFDQTEWDKRRPLNSETFKKIEAFKKKFPFVVGYAGLHSSAYSLSYLIEAFSILSSNNSIGLILVGDGPDKLALIDKAQKLNLKNILFLDPITKEEVPHFLEQIDVAYISLKKTPLFKYGISPNKLIDYMAAAKPILYAIDTERDQVQESNCGVHVDPHNPEQIAASILQMAHTDKPQLRQMGERGRKWLKDHVDYNVLIRKYETLLTVKKLS